MGYSSLSTFDSDFVSTITEMALKKGAIDLAGSYAIHDSSLRWSEGLFSEALHQNRYIPYYGLQELRQQISVQGASTRVYRYDAETEVTITSGIHQCLFATMTAVLREGDEVLLFEPANEAYLPNILLSGARPVYISLQEPGFTIDWEQVTRMITPDTRMIVISTPHNPTGAVFNELDMLRLQKIINGTNIIILSDESNEFLLANELDHQSVTMYPKIAEHSIIVNSFEGLCDANWSVAYCAAPMAISNKIRQVLRITADAPYSPLQQALANCLADQKKCRSVRELFMQKKAEFIQAMETRTKFTAVKGFGTAFQLFDYSNLSDDTSKDFALRILDEVGVGVAPYSAFYHDKQKKPLLRFNLARPQQMLMEAVEKLSSL
jgi:methionine aminotransferase